MTREEAIEILSSRDNHGMPCGYTNGYVEALDMAIESLKEHDVVEELTQDLADSLNDAYAIGYNAAKREIALSMEYERAYQRGKADATKWIPCSERLPEENVPVNVTWVNGMPELYYADIKDKPFTATGVYFKGKWYWYSSTVEDLLAEYGRAEWDDIEELTDNSIEILAWMPLPEPYKAESEDKE